MTSSNSLHSQLIGSWRLTSFNSIPAPSSSAEPKQQMGAHPNGLLIYNADGYMSALMTSSDPDVHLPKAAYAGRWTTEGEVVNHHVETSSEEQWVGTTLKRRAEWSGEGEERELVLTTLDSYGPPVSSREAVKT